MRRLTNEEINVIAGGVSAGDARWVVTYDAGGRTSEQFQIYTAQYFEATLTGFAWVNASPNSESAY